MWPSREQGMIQSLLRCSVGGETDPERIAAFSEGTDWNFVLDMAAYHGISHLLLSALKQNRRIKVPGTIIDSLENEYLKNHVMHMVHEGALKDIVLHFNAEGIRFVVHKGLGLAALLYPEPQLRPCGGDLDILVPMKDYPVTRACLKKMGYSLSSLEYEVHEISFIGEVKFEKNIGGKKVTVDLHTDLIANHWGKVARFKMEDFWGNLRSVKYNDFFIPYLPPEVYLFFLCIHCSANHIFDRLITFCDLDLFIKKYSEEIDWDHVARYARKNGAMKVIYHPLNFCNRLLGTPLPPNILMSVKPGRFSLAMVPERHLLMRQGEPPKSLERYMHLVLLDNPFYIFRSVTIFLKRLFRESSIRRKPGSTHP